MENSTILLSSKFESLQINFLNLSDTIATRLAELEVYEQDRKKSFERVDQLLSKPQERVKLQFVNAKYETYKSTLLRFEDSYFTGLLSGKFGPPNEKGYYQIDATTTHFDRILDYLRTGKFDWSGLDSYSINRIEEEISYFLLPSPHGKTNNNNNNNNNNNFNFKFPFKEPEPVPVHQFGASNDRTHKRVMLKRREVPQATPIFRGPYAWDATNCSPHLHLTDSHTATKTDSVVQYDAVIANQPTNCYQARVIRGINGKIMVGFITKDKFKSKPTNFSDGYYISLEDGFIYSPGNGKLQSRVEMTNVVDIYFEQINNTIRCSIRYENGKRSGDIDVFQSIPPNLYPVVCIATPGASVAIIQFTV